MEKIIITIATVILGMGGMAGGSAVDSNSVVQDGIEYYIQTNKSVYDLGEDVELLYRVTNLGVEITIFDFPLAESEQSLFTVEEEGIRIWGRRVDFSRVISGFVLNPGEFKEYTGIWNMTADNGTLNPDDDTLINPGIYNIIGRLNLTGGTYIGDENTRVSVLVTIIREPPTVYYVDADANGLNDGSSWADAYNYLQDGLVEATSGDEIWVAQGIYKPDQGVGITPGDRTATFQLISSVTLKGGYAGFGEPDPNDRDIELYETILSGDLSGNDGPDFANNDENSFHVVTGNRTDANAVLDGFTITAGNANASKPNNLGGGLYNNFGCPTVFNCTFSRNMAVWWGGAMCNYSDSSPMLVKCTFNSNSADYQGGGMFNYSNSNPVLTNCRFAGNYADWHGGGMYNKDSNPTLTNCTFSGNSARGVGGGMDNMHESNPILTGCTFSGNSAGSKAGGMANTNSSNPVLTNCTFTRNYSKWHGGGIGNRASSPRVTNCTFSGNYAHYGGATHSDSGSSPTLTNCTFTGNTAIYGGGMYNVGDGGPILTNCILWGDTPEEIYVSSGMLLLTYCDVEGGWDGEGNVDADPRFISPGYWDANGVWAEGDYHLLEDSPCIDAGDPNYIAEPNETDLDGRPRVIGGRIDMGAFEYSPPIPAEVRIVPRTINLTSKGKWITSLFWLPEDYNVVDIDPNSVFLEYEIGADEIWLEGQVAMVKFSRSKVQEILEPGDVELTVSGELSDGSRFEGTDTIRVIDKGKKK